MGIEPTYAAWKAAVLPLNYTRVGGIGRSGPTLEKSYRPEWGCQWGRGRTCGLARGNGHSLPHLKNIQHSTFNISTSNAEGGNIRCVAME